MSKFDKAVSVATEIASMVKGKGVFELNLDDTGGYIEIDGITVHFDDQLDHTQTDVSL